MTIPGQRGHSRCSTLASAAWRPARALLLDGWARHAAERAEDTAVAQLRAEDFSTCSAGVEEAASLGRHGLQALVSAMGAGQVALQLQGRHSDVQWMKGGRTGRPPVP